VRTDGAGATHELLDYCPERRLRCSVAYEQTDQLRAAILHVREDSSIASLASDGSEPQREVAEIIDLLDLTPWPTRSRVIVRREPRNPSEQCRLPTKMVTASKRP
jgi:hypothetical protein